MLQLCVCVCVCVCDSVSEFKWYKHIPYTYPTTTGHLNVKYLKVEKEVEDEDGASIHNITSCNSIFFNHVMYHHVFLYAPLQHVCDNINAFKTG